MLHYLLCQGEGDFSLHSNCKDPLVAIDNRVGDGGQSWVADLQTHTSNVPHTLRRNKNICKNHITALSAGLGTIPFL